VKKQTESDVLRQCLDYLQIKGILAWRSNQIPARTKTGGYRKFVGRKGVADILGCLDDGRLLAVEVKSATGKLKPEQELFLSAVRDRGGVALVIRDVTELQRELEDLHG
jgi:hypothetical protein